MKVSKTKKLIITLVSISLVLIYCLINDPSREITLTLGLYAGSSWDVPNGESYQVIDQAIQKFEKKYPNVKIEYKIIKETGPDHNKTFEAEVCFNGKVLATGVGTSKKSAEMQAAKKALGE